MHPQVKKEPHPIESCITSLNRIAEEKRLVIAIDTYEELNELDWWLREVPDESLQALVEAASLVRSFDQELLEWMLGFAIESSLFRKLIDLSFIRPSQGGYYIHALLGKALSREIRSRTPKRYSRLWQRSIAYYHREIVNNSSELDLTETIASLMYGLGDSILLSTFFEEAQLCAELLRHAIGRSAFYGNFRGA